MDDSRRISLENRLLPAPVFVHAADGSLPLDNSLVITLAVPDGLWKTAENEAVHLAEQYWKCRASARKGALSGEERKEEEYTLQVNESGIILECISRAGLLHGFQTLRQMAEPRRTTPLSESWKMPFLTIRDYPRFGFRGIHWIWLPEIPEFEIERAIRLAAACKFNYFILESWGVFKCPSHPELCWTEYAVEPETVKRLVRLGKELGVTLIPQFTVFGHAPQSRCCTGKHALLDFHPEYASLFEPDGWSWCISNPATRQYQQELVLDLLEMFDNPPFFHIGCDEAYNAGTCESCSENFVQKLGEHIEYFRKLLAEHGAKTLMWHDMLLDSEDDRWKGYRHYGNSLTKELIHTLSREIILCDWEYNGGDHNGPDGTPTWPTVCYFQEQGFNPVLCPFDDTAFTKALGKAASELNAQGILGTTWHHAHGLSLFDILASTAMAAWCPDHPAWKADYLSCSRDVILREFFNRMVRLAGHDMHITRYAETGSIMYQIPEHSASEGH